MTPEHAQRDAETARQTIMINKGIVKLTIAAAMLGYMPWAAADEKVSYPTERVATFVVDNLDVTSLPSVFRAKKEKGKKTFADYSYTTHSLEDKKALVETSSGGHVLSD
jgi:hypothetical protein